jgi:hypothetical protein
MSSRAERPASRLRRSWSLVAGAALLSLAACSGSDGESNDPDADRGTEVTTNSGTGTDEAQGGCADEVTNAAATAGHVDNGTAMDYEGVPPVSGLHWGQWPEITPQVYESDERPDVGELVHSQEHGWTIVWYDEALGDDDAAMAELQAASDEVNDAGAVKVVFVPWSSDDGDAFPDDAQVAITHWTGPDDEREVRQFCASANAEAIAAFSERWPYDDSREPDAP